MQSLSVLAHTIVLERNVNVLQYTVSTPVACILLSIHLFISKL